MRIRSTAVMCLALVLLVNCTCLADINGISKYTQAPKMEGGYSFASMQQTDWGLVAADDWVCADGLPIIELRWWGSYWTPPSPGNYIYYSDGLSNATPGTNGFLIGIFANAPADGNIPFDRPGTPIVAMNFGPDKFTESKIGEVNTPVPTDIYEYSVKLEDGDPIHGPAGPFAQEQGKKYWLGILALMPPADTDRQWGWRQAEVVSGAFAVQATDPTNPTLWYYPCGGVDLAFELTVVPEPASLVALMAGLTGLAGCIRRSRMRSASRK